MVKSRGIIAGLIFLCLLLCLGGCDQIGLVKNNKTRIAGSWYQYEHGFKDDSVYYFSEGMIKRDDSAWGSYKFAKNSVIEVDLGGAPERYEITFNAGEDVMTWVREGGDTEQIAFEWRRE